MYTLQILTDRLNSDLVTEAHILSGDPVSSVRFFSGGSMSDCILYLSAAGSGSTFCRTARGSSFRYAEDPCTTMNRILETLGYIAEWEEALHQAIRKGCTLTELLDLAYPVITYPMIILDSHQWMIACSSALETKTLHANKDIEEMLRFRSTSPERIAEFNRMYSSCFSRKDVYKIPGNFFSDTGYAMNLFHGDQFRGIMLIDSFHEQISPGKLDLFFLLGTHIQNMLNDPASGLSISNEEPSLLHYLVLPDEENRKKLVRDLKIAGWEDHDEKQAVFIVPSAGRSLSPNVDHALTMFNHLFGLIAVPHRNGILLFLNLRLLDERNGYDTILQRIAQLSYCAGISNPFTELSQLSVCVERAAAALQLGDKTAGAVNDFRQFWLPYFFSLKEQSDKDLLRHPFPDHLKERDRRFGSRLYETLFYYLKNERGITRCAKEMKISRNTLLHRIERIEEYADGILDDPYTRLQILLSYYLEKNDFTLTI